MSVPSALSLDIKTVPWSCKGSFISLARTARLAVGEGVAPQTNVYLVSQCVALSMPVFALRPLTEGTNIGELPGFSPEPTEAEVTATVSSVQWRFRDQIICEATFQDDRTLRFRGTVPLAFDTDVRSDMSRYMGVYIYPRPAYGRFPAGADVTYKTFPGYRFLPLKGEITTVNGARNDWLLNRRVQVQGTGGDSSWELVFHELDVGRTDRSTFETSCDAALENANITTFEAAKDRVAQDFDQFSLRLCSWAGEELSSTDILASYITWMSMVRKDARFTREAVLMSKLWMNKVWSWDNCFNGLGLIPYDVNAAIDQFLVMYDHQAPDGRIPDSVDWQNVEWGFTKPPIQGWALSKLVAARPSIEEEVLSQLYTHTAKLTDFWLETRRGSHSALPFYVHGNDSGWDNSTAFDATPLVIAPDCAAYLIVQADYLTHAARHLRLDPEVSQKWMRVKISLVAALVSELWDGESFVMKNAITGDTFKSTALLRLMPLVAAKHLPSRIVDIMITDLDKHFTEWGLATEELESTLYEKDGYWRGPIWAPSTYLIESGLREAGKVDIANTIGERFIALCEKSGFAENFDARTGEGLRDLSYTWTTAVYLLLKRERRERKR